MTDRTRRILFLDTYYHAVFADARLDASSYDARLASLLSLGFGTADHYSRAFRAAGWDAADVVANCDQLQRVWEAARYPSGVDSLTLTEIARTQVNEYRPDVLWLQDVSFFPAEYLREFKRAGIRVVAQVSCPMPPDDRLREVEHVFTSFPHYAAREFPARHIPSTLCPLAFPLAGARATGALVDAGSSRQWPIVFVGGVGDGRVSGWWRAGTEALEALATAHPELLWFGYGVENLRHDSPLRACYRGRALWGYEMLRAYGRASMAINRHGEVAEASGNNMRQYEATGMGALLLTDQPGAFADGDTCAVYTSPADLVRKVEFYFANEGLRHVVAQRGQEACLAIHTYEKRMPVILAALAPLVEGRA